MSDANEALAEVRGWLCDNLGSGDAGKVCGMLSVVSRRINELEVENDKLRDAMYTNAGKHALQHMDEDELRIWATQQSEYIEELKELVREMRSDLLPIACPWVDEYDKRMRELGLEDYDD